MRQGYEPFGLFLRVLKYLWLGEARRPNPENGILANWLFAARPYSENTFQDLASTNTIPLP
jgi:hypothetical protein